MAKAKINSGAGRASKTKTATPAKPSPTKVRTGFQALGGLNTSGTRQAIPHDISTSPAKTGSDLKLRLSGISTPKRGKPMY